MFVTELSHLEDGLQFFQRNVVKDLGSNLYTCFKGSLVVVVEHVKVSCIKRFTGTRCSQLQ
jgi:hypothetical protein